jgi:hypothetical protein
MPWHLPPMCSVQPRLRTCNSGPRFCKCSGDRDTNICYEIGEAIDGDSVENATILYSELQPSATACESVLQFADSQGAVAQWLELGTHNP